MGPADSHRISRVPRYSGLRRIDIEDSHTGLSPSAAVLSGTFCFLLSSLHDAPTTPAMPQQRRFGLLRVRSPLLAQSLLFSSPMGTKMFQFPTFAFPLKGMSDLTPDGLPHSDIPESQVICTYTGLFAACHVLLRLREPRHPPSALAYFRSSCPFDLNGQADFLFLLSFLSSRFAFSNMSKIFFLWRITESNR